MVAFRRPRDELRLRPVATLSMVRTILYALGASILSGLLFAASLPPAHFGLLAWFAFVPLILAVRERGFLFGFLSALVAIVVCSITVTNGLFLPPSQRTNTGNAAWIATACGIFGFVILLAVASSAEGTSKGTWRLIKLAALAVLLEGFLLLELPAHLALTQYRSFLCLQMASVTGIWGVSFLVWLSNFALADLVRQKSWRGAASWVALAVIVSVCPFPPDSRNVRALKVAVIQTTRTDISELSSLNAEAAREGAVIAVWPEFAGLEGAPQGDTKVLKELPAEAGQTAFITSFNDDAKPLPHNVAALFTSGSESKRYYKRNLFGGETTMHTKGTEAASANWNGVGIGLNVCYDSCFPQTMLDTARLPGVALLTLPTIDPDSPNGFFAAAHSAYSPFRAAELGIPIIRADGYGYSSIVNREGRILATVGVRPDTVLVAEVNATPRWTLFKVLGDWFLYADAAIFVIAIIASYRAKRPAAYSKNSIDSILPVESNS